MRKKNGQKPASIFVSVDGRKFANSKHQEIDWQNKQVVITQKQTICIVPIAYQYRQSIYIVSFIKVVIFDGARSDVESRVGSDPDLNFKEFNHKNSGLLTVVFSQKLKRN